MNALITGGTRGIGLGIAEAMAKEGINLILNGVRPENEVRDVIKKLMDYRVKVHYCQGDLSSSRQRETVVQKSLSFFEEINILINNAGVAPMQRVDILDTTEESYDRVMEVNLKGSFFLTQQLAKHMISTTGVNSNQRKYIINISSVSSIIPSINRSEYCISKAGMTMTTKLFASKLADHGIMVYEIQPGIIETDMTAGVLRKYEDLIEDGLTIQKRVGKPKDIGNAVIALVRGDFSYSTGQTFVIDGGLTIQRL